MTDRNLGGQPRSEARKLVLKIIMSVGERGITAKNVASSAGMSLEDVRTHIRNSVTAGEVVGFRVGGARCLYYVAADGISLEKQRHLNARSHSTAHITKAGARNLNLSPERARVEAYMARIGRPVTVPMLVQRLGIDAKVASACLTRMAAQGQVRRVGRDEHHKMEYAWHTYETTGSGNAQREVVRNSNAPTGSTEFWQGFVKAMMTPARVELQG